MVGIWHKGSQLLSVMQQNGERPCNQSPFLGCILVKGLINTGEAAAWMTGRLWNCTGSAPKTR